MAGKIYSLLLAVIVFTFLNTVIVKAQSFNGGLHGGLVGSQVAGDLQSGYNKAGLSAGAWVSLNVSANTEYQMELSFIQKGSRANPDHQNGRFDSYLMRISYIELPVLYRMIFSEKLNFEAGPAINFLIHHYESFNSDELDDYEFAKSNLCLILGLSYNLNEQLRVNMRTNNSLFSIRYEKRPGNVWRFWDHGQFSDALVFSLYYEL